MHCHHYILTGCRYKQPHIKNGYRGFSIKGQISRSMKLEKKLLLWC